MKSHTALAGTHSMNPLYYKEPATALSREAASYSSNIRMISLNERHCFLLARDGLRESGTGALNERKRVYAVVCEIREIGTGTLN